VGGGEYEGCPYGAVCIYPRDKGWNNGKPSNVYWSYGVHKLYNQIGNHYVFNNQSAAPALQGLERHGLCRPHRCLALRQQEPDADQLDQAGSLTRRPAPPDQGTCGAGSAHPGRPTP
jgi:hypothetical protein